MAPKTPKGAKRTEKEGLEKDATKVAKEQPDQTPGAAAVESAGKDLADATKKVDAVESEPVKAAAADDQAAAGAVQGKDGPSKGAQGDPVADAAKDSANGSKANEPEKADATAAGIEAGKTKAHEEPKDDGEKGKVVEAGIGEAKPVTEAE